MTEEIDGRNSNVAAQRVNSPIRWHIHASWVAGALLLAYTYGFVNAMVRASENIDECRHVGASLSSKYQLPPSVSTPGSPAIFCDAAVHFPLLNVYDNIFIYGVVSPVNQNAIEASLREFHAAAHTRPILLQFFDKENWRTPGRPQFRPQRRQSRPRNRHSQGLDSLSETPVWAQPSDPTTRRASN